MLGMARAPDREKEPGWATFPQPPAFSVAAPTVPDGNCLFIFQFLDLTSFYRAGTLPLVSLSMVVRALRHGLRQNFLSGRMAKQIT